MRSDDISKYDRKGETNMANNELILAVDDEAHILELLSFNLEASGYRVVTAATGEDATTIEDVVEPFLIQLGFIARTPRGRTVLPLAYEHLGFEYIEK